ncbi:lysine-specific demethylase 5C-like [Stylophora pistillata]|uniref:lysine-specific demethylase 5C-like n=1 Tax=Stylophora pistillata TaxID=50429 RepID=UPI000C053009|nr:lysine-specific demethylase 5C-like [Stylophora pistillata]
MEEEGEEFVFTPPPEAPVFEPTEEEFQDPLAYIAKIRPYAERTGICKVRPPPEWQPPFSVDVETFRFTPRVQRLNELEARTRVKLNFLDRLAKLWELQGTTFKIPTVERKSLDLFRLHKTVSEEGGFEYVTRKKKWSVVARKMGYLLGKSAPSLLRMNYEKYLYPYDIFQAGAFTGDPQPGSADGKKDQKEKEYAPNGGVINTNYQMSRRSKKVIKAEELDSIDFENNPELKKLQFLAPGPKMAGVAKGTLLPKQEVNIKEELLDSPVKIEITNSLEEKEKDKEKTEPSPRKTKMNGDAMPSPGKQRMARQKQSMKLKLENLMQKEPELTRRRPVRQASRKNIYSNSQLILPDEYLCQVCSRGDSEESMLLCDGCDDSYHTYCLIPPLSSVPRGDWRCPRCVAEECKKPQEAFGFEQAKREYTLQSFGEMADNFKREYFKLPPEQVPTEVVEKEFWRLVSTMDEDVTVEYGADLHTATHGSGFPTKFNAVTSEEEFYAKSGWNLNNLANLERSVLSHISADISGMKVPWIYVGMCFSSFCWHNEDHWSYSINYMHWGEPKTWYGVPGDNAEDFERSMKEAAPELFEAQPDLLHQLVTIINPNALTAKGVPVVRTNQYAGEFVITFPRAYHAGFNNGLNLAEAVNFATADWLPIGRKCIQHYREMTRNPVFSHEELVCKMAADPDGLDLDLAKAVYDEMLAVVEKEANRRHRLAKKGISEFERGEAFELLPDDERQCGVCKTTCFLSAVQCHCSLGKLVCLDCITDICPCVPPEKSLRYARTFKIKVPILSFSRYTFPPHSGADNVAATRLSLDELQGFMQQLQNLPCVVREADLVQELMTHVESFQCEAQKVIQSGTTDTTRLQQLLDNGHTLDVDLPEIPKLKQELRLAKWLEQVNITLANTEDVSFDALQELLETGNTLPQKAAIEKAVSELRSLVALGERWEEKAKLCLQARPRHAMTTVEAIVKDASRVPLYLPNVSALKEALRKAREWSDKVDHVQNDDYYPYLDVLEALVMRGRPIPVRLEQLPQMESQVAAARAWRDRAARTFLKKNSSATLLEILSPRKDVGSYKACPKPRGSKKRDKAEKEKNEKEREVIIELVALDEYIGRDPALQIAEFREAESKEMQSMRQLRLVNIARQKEEDKKRQLGESLDGQYCTCRRGPDGFMLQCELCKEWYHGSCVPLPRTQGGKSMGKGSAALEAAKELKYLCPLCSRSRRPRLETILSLLVSLQKLPVRLPEGEALQFLTERAMNWQDRARQFLADEDVVSLLTFLSRTSAAWPQGVSAENLSASAALLRLAQVGPESENAEKSASSEVSVTDEANDSAQAEVRPTFSEEIRRQAETMMMEGDLLEVSLDETEQLWKILLSQKSQEEQETQLFEAKSAKEKVKRKRKKKDNEDKEKPARRGSNASSTNSAPATSETPKKRRRKDKEKVVKVKKEKMVDVEEDDDEDDDDDDEICAAGACTRPQGDEVGWVQCDVCQKWYHLACVGLSPERAEAMDSYNCLLCVGGGEGSSTNSAVGTPPGASPESENVDVDGTTPTSPTPPVSIVDVEGMETAQPQGQEPAESAVGCQGDGNSVRPVTTIDLCSDDESVHEDIQTDENTVDIETGPTDQV